MNILNTIGVMNYSNELSFVAGLFVSVLFYLQYRKYEYEMERQEMLDKFLG